MLRSVLTADNKSTSVNYITNTGLISSLSKLNGTNILFSYEKNGRVKDVNYSEPERSVTPQLKNLIFWQKIAGLNNRLTSVKYGLNSTGIVAFMNRTSDSETWVVNASTASIFKSWYLVTF